MEQEMSLGAAPVPEPPHTTDVPEMTDAAAASETSGATPAAEPSDTVAEADALMHPRPPTRPTRHPRR